MRASALATTAAGVVLSVAVAGPAAAVDYPPAAPLPQPPVTDTGGGGGSVDTGGGGGSVDTDTGVGAGEAVTTGTARGGSQLPVTGSEVLPLGAAGGGLVLLGVGALVLARRRATGVS